MAFIRWRGNSAELLATIYDHGRSRQVRLACLGGAFSVEPGERAAAGVPNDRIEWLDVERRLEYWAILTEPLRPGEAQRLRAAAAVLHAWREAKPDFAFAEPPAGWDEPLAPEARSMTSAGIPDPANVRASR